MTKEIIPPAKAVKNWNIPIVWRKIFGTSERLKYMLAARNRNIHLTMAAIRADGTYFKTEESLRKTKINNKLDNQISGKK